MTILYMQVTVENIELETRNKKDGKGTYQTQTAYAHLLERNGMPKRYPVQIKVFPPKDNAGNVRPYTPGEYLVSPKCFLVDSGFLKTGFIELEPMPKAGAK
jgi:hypothetical protein